ncbi:MAG: hypothetical protein AAGI88_23590 [Pseudomonadota bacterium]
MSISKKLLTAMLMLLGAAKLSAEAEPRSVDAIAREYVLLELAMGEHDPAHVDAYFGPDSLKKQAKEAGLTPQEILQRADVLDQQLASIVINDPLGRLKELRGRLTALKTRVSLFQGELLSFDEESQRLFGATAPDYDAAYFEAILLEIGRLLPGEGELSARVNAFRDQFNIPDNKLDAVFSAAIEECRRRTQKYVALPTGENFRIEYVTDKPWGGYNWYEGNAVSLIQVNTDLPTAIDRAVDLGCHEGYPGHHVYNALLERDLLRERGWVEFSLYPLFSPQSLIAEGSANYGIQLAFPGEERVTFEKTVLFPLAGLNADDADRYYELQSLMAKLSYAGNEAARDFLDGTITRAEAQAWLVRYALNSPERAAKRLTFIETYRSYVINYNLGMDLVADYVERDDADIATRWQRFARILSQPMSASDLK